MALPLTDTDFDDSSGSPDTADDRGLSADLVRAYLNGIGRTPLLTAAGEVDLAKRIEAGLFAEQRLAASGFHRQAGQHDAVPRDARLQEEDAQLQEDLETIVAEGMAAKTQLLEANLRLVVSIAKRYTGRGMPLLDLIQEGNLGLIRAVEKFDYTKGYKFSTYATWWIRQAITRAMADQARTIRIPVHVVEHLNRLVRARRDLANRLGREPRYDELAGAVGLPPWQVVELLGYDREPISLDHPIGADQDTTLADLITADAGPADTRNAMLLRHAVTDVLATLTEREQAVIRLRYGLDDGHQRTLDEVGHAFGLSRERIRQIEKTTLLKLRDPSRSHQLAAYVG